MESHPRRWHSSFLILFHVYSVLLCDLYSSPSIVRIIKSRMRWVGHAARMEEKRNAYRLLVGKPEGKGPLGRPRHR
jgi:hypothetical protein